MLIDSSLYLIILCARFLFFIARLIFTHIVIADAAFAGLLAYIAPDMFPFDVPSGVRWALAVAVFLLIVILSKWTVSFAIITLVGSYFWACLLLIFFSMDPRKHILAAVIIMLVNILLHISSRQKIFGPSQEGEAS